MVDNDAEPRVDATMSAIGASSGVRRRRTLGSMSSERHPDEQDERDRDAVELQAERQVDRQRVPRHRDEQHDCHDEAEQHVRTKGSIDAMPQGPTTTMSIAATGPTPRPTTTVAASTNEHAAMRPVPRSGVQAGLLDPPAARVHITLGALYELAEPSVDEPAGQLRRAMSCSPAEAELGRGTEPSVERPRATAIDEPASSRVGAESGRRTGSSDGTGGGGAERRVGFVERRCCGRSCHGLFASGTAVPREGHRRRRDQPAEEHEIGKALLLGLDERRRFGALDDAKLDAVLHRDLGRELSGMDHVEEGASWRPTSARSPWEPTSPVALIVIIGVEALTVDGTAAAAIGSDTVLQVLLVEQAAPLELAGRLRHWWRESRRRRSGPRSVPCRRATC